MSNPLSELLARGEGGYGSYNRGRAGDAGGRTIDFSRMTLGEVQALQHLPRQDPDRLFAVGKYQIIPGTMDMAVRGLRLDPNQRFTPELQERIFADYLISEKQPGIRTYITGQPGATLRTAQIQLANEWASVAHPDTGLSVHGRVGNNRASISADRTAEALDAMRTQYATNIQQGMSPEQAWRAVTATGPEAARTQQTPAASDAQRIEPQSPGQPALLKQGSRSAEVWDLQTTLHALGYTGADGQPLKVDSDFGNNTDHAVRAFQRGHGLEPVDGKVGKDTRAALIEAAKHPLVSEAAHPNHKLYEAIAAQLPAVTNPKVAANITLQAMENGITSPDRLQRMVVVGSDAYLQGPYPGDRVKVDLAAPTPDLQAMSDHMARQTAERTQEAQSRQQSHQPQISM